MSVPSVSVIMTVFSRTEYLEEAIRSVLAQTFGDLELIVTDDAPSDVGREICAKYAADGRIRYRRNVQTLGAPLNVGAAMREARGKYVTIMNDDDVAESCMLEKLVRPLDQNPQCSVCFADHWIMDAAGKLLPEITQENSRLSGRNKLTPGMVMHPLRVALRGGVPFVMGTMFRKDSYREEWLVKEVEGAYDRWMAICFARVDRPFYYLNERVFRYRAHELSETARQDPEKVRSLVYMFGTLLQQNVPLAERQFVKKALAHSLFVLGRDRLFWGRLDAARNAFLKAADNGMRIKGYLGVVATFMPRGLWSSSLTLWRRLRGINANVPSAHAKN